MDGFVPREETPSGAKPRPKTARLTAALAVLAAKPGVWFVIDERVDRKQVDSLRSVMANRHQDFQFAVRTIRVGGKPATFRLYARYTRNG